MEKDVSKLECHFTWDLEREDADLNFLEVKFTESVSGLSENERNLRGWNLNILAYVKHLQGANDKAVELLKIAEEENSANEKQCVVTYGNLVWVHNVTGDHAAAQTYTEKLQDIYHRFPVDSPGALVREVKSEKAWSFLHFSRKYYQRARDCYHDALQTEPDDKEWNTGFAFSLFHLEGLETREDVRLAYEESPAVVQLKKALTLDPGNAIITIYLGLKCFRNERNAEAWQHMRHALRMAPEDLTVVLMVARFMKKEECYDMALEVLKKMLKKAPYSARLHHEIANNYRWKARQIGDVHNQRLLGLCIRHLEKGAQLNPAFLYPQMELAMRYAEKCQAGKAEQKFQELFERPDLRPADLQAWHRLYGDFNFYRLGSAGTAVEHYKKGLMMQRVSTDWKVCKQRLFKILRNDRSDIYQINEFMKSHGGGQVGEEKGSDDINMEG